MANQIVFNILEAATAAALVILINAETAKGSVVAGALITTITSADVVTYSILVSNTNAV